MILIAEQICSCFSICVKLNWIYYEHLLSLASSTLGFQTIQEYSGGTSVPTSPTPHCLPMGKGTPLTWKWNHWKGERRGMEDRGGREEKKEGGKEGGREGGREGR